MKEKVLVVLSIACFVCIIVIFSLLTADLMINNSKIVCYESTTTGEVNKLGSNYMVYMATYEEPVLCVVEGSKYEDYILDLIKK